MAARPNRWVLRGCCCARWRTCSIPCRSWRAGSGRCATKRGRTFADILTGTEVRQAGTRPRPEGIRAKTGAAFVAAAALSVIAAVVSYLLVFQREHSAEVARASSPGRGPKIVADMLSYDPKTLPDDFARAQSLATEKYREQLVPQQDAIRNGAPVPNYYRVADAAVLNATPRRGRCCCSCRGSAARPERSA